MGLFLEASKLEGRFGGCLAVNVFIWFGVWLHQPFWFSIPHQQACGSRNCSPCWIIMSLPCLWLLAHISDQCPSHILSWPLVSCLIYYCMNQSKLMCCEVDQDWGFFCLFNFACNCRNNLSGKIRQVYTFTYVYAGVFFLKDTWLDSVHVNQQHCLGCRIIRCDWHYGSAEHSSVF